MQTSKSIEDFFLDDKNNLELWDWEQDAGWWWKYRTWFWYWYDLKKWLYDLYYGQMVKLLPYHRCRLCKQEIDVDFIYNMNDLRNKYCLECYERECQEIIDKLTIDV